MTWFYPLLERQRPLLEQLGPDSMSSDEEREGGGGNEFNILVPIWRSGVVTAWLRIFDMLYFKARRDGLFRDHRGSYPRTRLVEQMPKVSTTPGFVAKLPENAYDETWLRGLVDVENIVRPLPRVDYSHDQRVWG